jgi:hypothetical protein
MPAKPEDSSCTVSHDNAGAQLACQHLTMGLLALKLPHLASSDLNMRVVDMTGLAGAWERCCGASGAGRAAAHEQETAQPRAGGRQY